MTHPEAKAFDGIHLSMSSMCEVTEQIFYFFDKKEEQKAAALMAEMDRRFAKLNEAIEAYRRLQTEQISSALYKHSQHLSASKELEIYLSILIVIAVICVSVFGKYLSRFVRVGLADAQKIQKIIEAISESAIVAITDKKGKITDVNDNFCKISGYSREELIGQDHRLINSGAHAKSFFKDLWQKISSGGIWTGDIQNIKKNGESYFVRSVIAPLKDSNGEIDQYVAIRFDVTEQKRAEKELIEAQEVAKIGSWKYDLLTGQLSWSPEHYRIFEIDQPQSQEKLFKLYRERIHPGDLPEMDLHISHALNYGKDFTYNHRVCLDNGSRIKHVQGIGKVTRDAKGQPIYISGTCQDLTHIVAL